jgi:hypothetical protein
MQMRVIPEQTRPLPARGRNRHLILELAARTHIDENVVGASARRHAQTVEMQVGRIVRQAVLQPDPHHVAKPHP